MTYDDDKDAQTESWMLVWSDLMHLNTICKMSKYWEHTHAFSSGKHVKVVLKMNINFRQKAIYKAIYTSIYKACKSMHTGNVTHKYTIYKYIQYIQYIQLPAQGPDSYYFILLLSVLPTTHQVICHLRQVSRRWHCHNDYAQSPLFWAAHIGYRYCKWPLLYISFSALHSPQGPDVACSSLWTGTQEQLEQEQVELGLHWMLRHQKLQATSKLRTRAVQSLMQWGQVRWGTPWWQQPASAWAADQEPAPPRFGGRTIHAVGLMSEEGAAVFPSVVEAGQCHRNGVVWSHSLRKDTHLLFLWRRWNLREDHLC